MTEDVVKANEADPNQMTLKELRYLLDKAVSFGAPPEGTFSLDRLANRGTLLVSWEHPRGSGKMTGVDIRREL